MSPASRTVLVVAPDGMQALGAMGAIEVFDAARQLLGPGAGYEVRVATASGAPIRTSAGLRLHADLAIHQVPPRSVDTLIVAGTMRPEAAGEDPRLVSGLQRISAGARRTCSVCTGSFWLAAAGLLEGRTATTHWAFARQLARRHPGVAVEPDRIFVRDGAVITSAGSTAGIDLAFALVEDDHGPDVARTIARWTVTFLQRPGGQSQFSERVEFGAGVDAPLRPVLDQIVAEPSGDHRLSELARRAALSERHFRRLFVDQTGITPARFVERVRVEAARNVLERTGTPIEVVATTCGFGSPETMRRTFQRVLGVGPADYRSRFRTAGVGRAPEQYAA